MDEKDPTEIVLEHLKVLRLEPGDVLVLRYPKPLSMHVAERLREEVVRSLGPDVRCMVLDDGLDMGVVRVGGAPTEG